MILYLVVKKLMITKNLVVEIKNLAVNNESQPIKSNLANPCEIADTKKPNINYSHKHFSEYLKHQCNNSIFIQPTNSEEIANIIFSPNINKASAPFSIKNKILILLKEDIFKQLADLFNPSFSSGSFSSILKTVKVVPVFKKDSKLDYCNYCPISPLSHVGKILEKLMSL